MLVLDVTIVAVALPDVRDALGMGVAEQQWVVNAYTLALGGFLLVGGRASDLLGAGTRTIDRGLAIGIDECAAPRLVVEQRLGDRISGAAMIEIGGDQHAAGPQQLAQRSMQSRHRRVAVKKGDVIAGIERRQLPPEPRW